VLPYKWTKLVFSCVVNPLSALTGLDADRLLRTAAALPAALEIISEVIQLANAEGVRLAREGPVSPYWLRRGNGVPAVVKKLILRAISFSLKNVKVSMLQDIENGRRTEIDFLNGFIVDRARGFGIETPRNELTTRLVKELESGALRPNTANLDRFRKRTELASPG
jgi:2-dehydropantoate 2-reductase